MSVKICSIASGSNGNCYYLGTEKEAILIDNGISYRMLKSRFQELGLSLDRVKAVFISHEHTDHIRGLPRFFKFHPQVPLFFNSDAFDNVGEEREEYEDALQDIIVDPIQCGNFCIYPFIKAHDTAYPLSFRVEIEGVSIGVFTDIGEIDHTFQEEFSKCQAVFLETNYDDDMLTFGPYPSYLKQRVQQNHLSNKEAFSLVKDFANKHLQTVIFSHISKDNNSLEKIFKQFEPLESLYTFSVASRDKVGDVFEVYKTK